MLYEKLEQYCKESHYPFHMPGHKRNGMDFNNINLPYHLDITEISGFDNLHDATGILKSCMDYAADCYGSDSTYFLINGSSGGILSAISAVVEKNDTIVVARNCHKAVYNGIYLNELKPIYIYPEIVEEFGVAGEIKADAVKGVLESNPDAKAVVLTSPTYEGFVSDISSIAEVVHEFGIPLIVDEAHGAHLKYSDDFPQSALENGADIVIQSVHKTLPSLTQTALLHVKDGFVSKKRLETYLSIYQSSSPSYILLASIDSCIRFLEDKREPLFETYTKRLKGFYTECAGFKHLKLADYKNKDISKLVISVKDYNNRFKNNKKVTGKTLEDILSSEFSLDMELVGVDYILAMTSCMDTEEGFERLKNGLAEIDKRLENALYEPDSVIFTKKAMENQEDMIQGIQRLVGREAEGYIYLYPPGIPLLVPGEICDRTMGNSLIDYVNSGLEVHGIKMDREG